LTIDPPNNSERRSLVQSGLTKEQRTNGPFCRPYKTNDKLPKMRTIPFLSLSLSNKMGSIGPETGLVGGEITGEVTRKPRFLCLHGFRTSGAIMRKQVVGKWPSDVTSRLDLFFADAPFPSEGKSDVEGIFPPPYFEWFQFSKVIRLSLCLFFFIRNDIFALRLVMTNNIVLGNNHRILWNTGILTSAWLILKIL
jgi:Serine hydrolase (FSH1)